MGWRSLASLALNPPTLIRQTGSDNSGNAAETKPAGFIESHDF